MLKLKSTLLLMVAGVAFTACQNNGKTAAADATADSLTTDSLTTDSLYFEGEVPGADVASIRYTIALAKDSTNGFRLTTTYVEDDKGKGEVFNRVGKKEIIKKTINGKEETVYKFTDGKDGSAEYFKLVGDSVLRMVNDNFEEAVAGNPSDYDLKLK